jgi:serine/threonine-protein kinase
LYTVAHEGKGGLSDSEATRVYDDAYLHAVARLSTSSPGADDGTHVTDVPDAAALRTGQVLAGKYRVERVVGVGGMGVVVAARNIHLDAPVALKFMTREAVSHHALVSRFLREARATARLRGEHVIRVSDVGELDSGAPYMVMEHLQGQDLGALLASLGPPPIASAVEYAIQACEGLDEAHRAGIVHRDIKPSNLFLTRRPNGTPCIKILDFGISKSVRMLHASESMNATSDHAVFGTPLYMAPEQMRAARDVDARADLWSLGASLYELLSGTVPFPAESIIALAYRIANEGAPSLRQKRPEIPDGLERIVLRCLERDPDRRFPDARSLAMALGPYRVHRGEYAHREPGEDDETRVMDPAVGDAPVPTPLADESLGTSSISWGPKQGPGGIARRRRLVAYAAAAVLGVGIAAVIGFTRGAPEPAPPPAKLVSAPAAVNTAPRVDLVTLPTPTAPTNEPPTVSISDLPSVPLRPVPVATAAASPPAAPSVVPKSDPDGILTATTVPASSKVVAPHPAPSARPDAADCSPPYYYDEVGLKIFKPECVN